MTTNQKKPFPNVPIQRYIAIQPQFHTQIRNVTTFTCFSCFKIIRQKCNGLAILGQESPPFSDCSIMKSNQNSKHTFAIFFRSAELPECLVLWRFVLKGVSHSENRLRPHSLLTALDWINQRKDAIYSQSTDAHCSEFVVHGAICIFEEVLEWGSTLRDGERICVFYVEYMYRCGCCEGANYSSVR